MCSIQQQIITATYTQFNPLLNFFYTNERSAPKKGFEALLLQYSRQCTLEII